MKLLLALVVIAVTLTAASTANATVLRLPHKPFLHMTHTEKVKYLRRQMFHDHSIIRFAKNHPSIVTAEIGHAVKWAQTSLRIAKASLKKLTAVIHHAAVAASGVVSALMCIHRYEGSWTDPNGPYWGGLQMDLSFQAAYGPEFLKKWGTADHWPIWAQLQAAETAVASRGFSPWPNTARLCGVL